MKTLIKNPIKIYLLVILSILNFSSNSDAWVAQEIGPDATLRMNYDLTMPRGEKQGTVENHAGSHMTFYYNGSCTITARRVDEQRNRRIPGGYGYPLRSVRIDPGLWTTNVEVIFKQESPLERMDCALHYRGTYPQHVWELLFFHIDDGVPTEDM